MAYLNSQGMRIFYEVKGSGPPLVLLAGIFQPTTVWAENGYVADLAAAYQLILIDLPGHGQSDRPAQPKDYGFRRLGTVVTDVLDALGIAQAAVLGYSFGGWVVHGLLLYQPDRLSSALLLDGFPAEGDDVGLRAYVSQDQSLTEAERQSRLVLANWATLELSTILAQIKHLLPNIRVPCLLLNSEFPADSFEATFIERSAQLIPNNTHQVLAGYGHADLLTNNALVVPYIKRFLASLQSYATRLLHDDDDESMPRNFRTGT